MTDVTTQPQNKESTPTDETNLKNLEREIALQQLQELPYLEPKTKYVKSNKFKVSGQHKKQFTFFSLSFGTPIHWNLNYLFGATLYKVLCINK